MFHSRKLRYRLRQDETNHFGYNILESADINPFAIDISIYIPKLTPQKNTANLLRQPGNPINRRFPLVSSTLYQQLAPPSHPKYANTSKPASVPHNPPSAPFRLYAWPPPTALHSPLLWSHIPARGLAQPVIPTHHFDQLSSVLEPIHWQHRAGH